MTRKKTGAFNYSLLVKNRPGELAKLTKILSDESIKVDGLLVANLGDRSCIRFSTTGKLDLRESFRRTGLRARMA